MTSSSLVILVALLSVFCVNSFALPSLRILGGSEDKTGSFPYVVSVRHNNAHVCGGSIIALNYVLTAAHCVSKVGTNSVAASTVTIRVGSPNQYAGGKLVKVEEIHIHYSYGSFLNDVALLKLQSPLVLDAKVQIIDLADNVNAVAPGNSVVIAGWGRTEVSGQNAYKLHQGDATVISDSECNDSIQYGYPSTLCVKNELGSGACSGDAGGPAVYQDKLVGVSNFVIGTCGTKYPDVYARVSYFHNWITSIIGAQ